MSPIERKWWFALPVMFIAMATTLWLLDYAQVPRTYSFAWVIIFSLCSVPLQRSLSFLVWVLLLWLAPEVADSKRAKGQRHTV